DAVELVTVRVVGIGTTPKPPVVSTASASCASPPPEALRERRRVYDGNAFVETPVFARTALRAGQAFGGPAVIEQYDATTYIGPGWRAEIDGYDNLVLEKS
ncbi:MAG: hydantoinase/oxoprolinase family protein, partial [Candidatus Eremiobacteraeota bacterium]|nr:hydantoinase/oxoprolinase family protein [Candidatus Eremiobacteraeota bacterium]